MLRKKEKEHKQEKNEEINFFSFNLTIIFLSLLILSLANSISFYTLANIEETQTTQKTDLDNIEEKVFHQSFNKESQEERAGRLEKFLFGITHANLSLEERLNKITNAIQTNIKKETPQVLYDESFNTGVIGTISQIEIKIFNRIFNDLPFQTRVSSLEDRLLSRQEIIRARKKPLLERVSILVSKAEINTNPQPQIQKNNRSLTNYSYTIDPRTNFLISEQTGEVVKDGFGNPIKVMLPQTLPQLPLQNNYGLLPLQNQLNPYLPYQNLPNQQPGIPGQIPPLDLFFDQGSGYGNDPGY